MLGMGRPYAPRLLLIIIITTRGGPGVFCAPVRSDRGLHWYRGRKPLRACSEEWGLAAGVSRQMGVFAAGTSSCGSHYASGRVLE